MNVAGFDGMKAEEGNVCASAAEHVEISSNSIIQLEN
jgi:hypothetical protein